MAERIAVPCATPLLRMSAISKRFGATHALRNVSLDLHPGQALALIGENGAGKSTLMKILSGAHSPDSGLMQLAGQPYSPRGPHAARTAGVVMIYQELNLAGDLTVEDNIMLGQERTWLGLVDRSAQRRVVRETLATLGHPDLSPTAPVSRLSVGTKQVVEIARALVSRAKVIVFDEPTSSLTHADADRLFAIIDRLRQQMGHPDPGLSIRASNTLARFVLREMPHLSRKSTPESEHARRHAGQSQFRRPLIG